MKPKFKLSMDSGHLMVDETFLIAILGLLLIDNNYLITKL